MHSADARQAVAKALEFCDQSLAVEEDNWETWQDRAAAIWDWEDRGIARDLQRGLTLNPDSDSLQKTLAIARDREKLQQERLQHWLNHDRNARWKSVRDGDLVAVILSRVHAPARLSTAQPPMNIGASRLPAFARRDAVEAPQRAEQRRA